MCMRLSVDFGWSVFSFEGRFCCGIGNGVGVTGGGISTCICMCVSSDCFIRWFVDQFFLESVGEEDHEIGE